MRIHLKFTFAMMVLAAVSGGLVRAADEAPAAGGEILPSVDQRFEDAGTQEMPDFQRHVMPLFGRLGCNGRACHGSFQGRGGFRLSLFGYDFKFDHDQLMNKENPRVDLTNVEESLIIAKPTDEDNHEGGKRYDKGSWQHHLIRRWIETGAKCPDQPQVMERLELQPAEIWFAKSGEQVKLKAIAVWADGSREDVTPLCRFVSGDDLVATVTVDGLVTATEAGDSHIIVTYDNGVIAVPVIRPVTDLVGEKYPQVPTPTKVDELIVAKLSKLGIVPSDLCTDAEFLRRVRLDMTGTLPTPQEVEAFLADTSADKRAKKVDELLETPAYAAWWTTKLCDFTGNNEQQLNNASPLRTASKDWYDWIHKRVADNTPYDKLVEGIACATSIKPGESYLDFCKEMSDLYRPDADKSFADLDSMTHYWARQDFVEIEARAVAFAYSFMGLRIQCAQCHKHPFDQWSKDDFHQFKNFFARVTGGRANGGAQRDFRNDYEKLVKELGLDGKRGNELQRALPDLLKEGKTVPFPVTYNVKTIQRTRNPMDEYPVFEHAKLLGGDVVDIKSIDEPRQPLMDWLRGPSNRFFAPAFVNRVWASYFNVGIVNPPDDLSLGNPPSNRPLLDYLAKGFIESGFDMKWVHRTIANSRTYQASWQPNESNRNDQRNFSHAIARRLPAEVAYDAIQQATAADEAVAAMQTDVSKRAIAIPAAGNRNGNQNGSAYALSVFGRSTRESNCDCDRSMEPTLLQTVFLQNDRDMLTMIDVRRGGWLDQVARELKVEPSKQEDEAADRQATGRLKALKDQIKQLESQIDRAESKNAPKEAIEKSRRRLALLKEKLPAERPVEPATPAAEPALAADVIQSVINQAYLRSLSRLPNDDERSHAVAYLTSAEDPVDGARDLLWALLNTKEFIVNH